MPHRSKKALAEALDVELRRLGASNATFVHAVAARLGLSPSDYEAMDVLEWTGPITAGELAAQLGVTSGAVTGLVDRLESSGWVRREPDPGDKRKVIIRLLFDRFDEVAPLYAGSQAAIAAIAERSTAAELEAITGALATMSDTFIAESARLRAPAPAHRRGAAPPSRAAGADPSPRRRRTSPD